MRVRQILLYSCLFLGACQNKKTEYPMIKIAYPGNEKRYHC